MALETKLAVQVRRTKAGELLIGLTEPSLGIKPARTVWLGKSELLSRFGIEGSVILVKKAQEVIP